MLGHPHREQKLLFMQLTNYEQPLGPPLRLRRRKRPRFRSGIFSPFLTYSIYLYYLVFTYSVLTGRNDMVNWLVLVSVCSPCIMVMHEHSR